MASQGKREERGFVVGKESLAQERERARGKDILAVVSEAGLILLQQIHCIGNWR